MRTQAPPLLPIFRSQAQAELLTWLYLHPGVEYSLSDLARQIGMTTPTIHREVERLVASTLLVESRLGRNRMVAANLAHPAADSLSRLLETTFGPRHVVAAEFDDIPGVEEVLIFGSWAARNAGEPGAFPRDVDVMVVGQPDPSEVYEAARRAEDRLGLPVNPVIRTRSEWEDSRDALSAEARRRPWLDARGGVE